MDRDTEDQDWQRLDKWLWCARVMRARTDCAGLVAQGSIRINRQPTVKPHAKLRIGDVLTIPVHGSVRVLQVAQLATRRGPPSQARSLYLDIVSCPIDSAQFATNQWDQQATENKELVPRVTTGPTGHDP